MNKRIFRGIMTAGVIIGMAVWFAGCEDSGSSSPSPSVTSVTVNPATASVTKGESQNFTATVTGVNNPDTAVTWSIVETNKNAGTTIGETTGILTVASAEALTTLTIKATSNADSSKSGTAAVTVTPATGDGNISITQPEDLSLTVSTAEPAGGYSTDFTITAPIDYSSYK